MVNQTREEAYFNKVLDQTIAFQNGSREFAPERPEEPVARQIYDLAQLRAAITFVDAIASSSADAGVSALMDKYLGAPALEMPAPSRLDVNQDGRFTRRDRYKVAPQEVQEFARFYAYSAAVDRVQRAWLTGERASGADMVANVDVANNALSQTYGPGYENGFVLRSHKHESLKELGAIVHDRAPELILPVEEAPPQPLAPKVAPTPQGPAIPPGATVFDLQDDPVNIAYQEFFGELNTAALIKPGKGTTLEALKASVRDIAYTHPDFATLPADQKANIIGKMAQQYTQSVSQDNPELAIARQHAMAVLRRSEEIHALQQKGQGWIPAIDGDAAFANYESTVFHIPDPNGHRLVGTEPFPQNPTDDVAQAATNVDPTAVPEFLKPPEEIANPSIYGLNLSGSTMTDVAAAVSVAQKAGVTTTANATATVLPKPEEAKKVVVAPKEAPKVVKEAAPAAATPAPAAKKVETPKPAAAATVASTTTPSGESQAARDARILAASRANDASKMASAEAGSTISESTSWSAAGGGAFERPSPDITYFTRTDDPLIRAHNELFGIGDRDLNLGVMRGVTDYAGVTVDNGTAAYRHKVEAVLDQYRDRFMLGSAAERQSIYVALLKQYDATNNTGTNGAEYQDALGILARAEMIEQMQHSYVPNPSLARMHSYAEFKQTVLDPKLFAIDALAYPSSSREGDGAASDPVKPASQPVKTETHEPAKKTTVSQPKKSTTPKKPTKLTFDNHTGNRIHVTKDDELFSIAMRCSEELAITQRAMGDVLPGQAAAALARIIAAKNHILTPNQKRERNPNISNYTVDKIGRDMDLILPDMSEIKAAVIAEQEKDGYANIAIDFDAVAARDGMVRHRAASPTDRADPSHGFISICEGDKLGDVVGQASAAIAATQELLKDGNYIATPEQAKLVLQVALAAKYNLRSANHDQTLGKLGELEIPGSKEIKGYIASMSAAKGILSDAFIHYAEEVKDKDPLALVPGARPMPDIKGPQK